MTALVVLTVVVIVVLIAGLAFYLYWAGTLLERIAGNLEEGLATAGEIVGHAKLIGPGVEHINRTGGVVAGALPLLYGMAEDIVADVTPHPKTQPFRSRPASARAAPASSNPSASPPTPKPSAAIRRRSEYLYRTGQRQPKCTSSPICHTRSAAFVWR